MRAGGGETWSLPLLSGVLQRTVEGTRLTDLQLSLREETPQAGVPGVSRRRSPGQDPAGSCSKRALLSLHFSLHRMEESIYLVGRNQMR